MNITYDKKAKKLQDKLKDSLYNPISMFLNLRNQKCKVYDSKVIHKRRSKRLTMSTSSSRSTALSLYRNLECW
jgi:hypothetical protein